MSNNEKKAFQLPNREEELARLNVPIIMDRATGQERFLFETETTEAKPEQKVEAKIEEQPKPKIQMLSSIVIPDWLQKEINYTNEDLLDLGDLQTAKKIYEAVCAHHKVAVDVVKKHTTTSSVKKKRSVKK